jgi:hypothetical protein
LVKAGSYAIDLLFKDGDFGSPPSASSKIFLEVAPKLNLSPGPSSGSLWVFQH